ncbi:glycosyltransferase [Patescibacteria group bacterium]|nr:glycosyltransferase [Patescibacteria group bacterium]MBU2579493.1 glycosyltransferase [Patescibacteria group bacterium]
MTQKSILYIITKSVWGGAAKYVYDLATHLPKSEFQITVAAGGKEKFAQKIAQAQIPYIEIANFQRQISFFREFFAFFEILSLLSRLKPDIIHVNSSKAGGVVGAAAWFYKIFSRRSPRLIFTAHGWAFSEDRPKIQIILIKIISRITALFYHQIICVSEYDRQTALKNKIAPARKLKTIHNGIDFEAISFLPREEAQRKLINKTSPLVIGTIAEWTKNKGLKYLLEAVKKIKDKEFDIIFIGSGENPDKKQIQELVEKHPLKKNIHLIEFVENAAAYLKAFDIFVLPSLKEGLPYTILEAMAAEVPIIATNVGGIPEILSLNLIQPKNSQQLAEKIKYFINNRENIKQKISSKFSLEKMVKETKELY